MSKRPSDERFAWRDPRSVLPDQAFDVPSNHRRFPRTELGRRLHDVTAASCMAGSAFRPTFLNFAQACARPTQTALERSYIREYFTQLHVVEQKTLMCNLGVTVFELARALRNSRVTYAPTTNWINRHAPGFVVPTCFNKKGLYEASQAPPVLVLQPGERERLATTLI